MTSTDNKIIQQYLKRYPRRALDLIEDYDNTEIASFLGTIPISSAISIISGIIPYKAVGVIKLLKFEDAVKICQGLPIKKAEAILMRFEASLRKKITAKLSKDYSEAIERKMSFSSDSVGAYMDSMVFTLRNDHKIGDSLELIKRKETSIQPQIYVLNVEGFLLGYVDLQDLLSQPTDHLISSILKDKPMPLLSRMSVEDVALEWDYLFNHLPVVDADGMFLGTVSRAKIGELVIKEQSYDQPARKAGSALSELYRIGFISLLGTSSEAGPKSNLRD